MAQAVAGCAHPVRDLVEPRPCRNHGRPVLRRADAHGSPTRRRFGAADHGGRAGMVASCRSRSDRQWLMALPSRTRWLCPDRPRHVARRQQCRDESGGACNAAGAACHWRDGCRDPAFDPAHRPRQPYPRGTAAPSLKRLVQSPRRRFQSSVTPMRLSQLPSHRVSSPCASSSATISRATANAASSPSSQAP